jgi:hypothetical protein
MGVSGQRHAPAALYHGERTPGTHCTGGWVGPRACLDTEARGKILCPAGDRTPTMDTDVSVVTGLLSSDFSSVLVWKSPSAGVSICLVTDSFWLED